MRIILSFIWSVLWTVFTIFSIPIMMFSCAWGGCGISEFVIPISFLLILLINFYFSYKFFTDQEYEISKKLMIIYSIICLPAASIILLTILN